ncbi:hypothetical protein BH23ACI1_BH23ACI1_08890 [soil metagenome]
MSASDVSAARLTIRRQSPRDAQQRQVVASLDGQPFATLMFGDVTTREIAPGWHRLRVHNTLVWKTLEFNVAPGEGVAYTIVNRAGWATWWMLSLLGAGPLYLTIDRDSDDDRARQEDQQTTPGTS